MTAPIRFESGRPMLLGGLRRHHLFQQGDFGGQWRDFGTQGPLPGQLGEHAYGVICGTDTTGCEYMCAVEVAALEVLPKSLGRMRIQAQSYAVFLHRGPCRCPAADLAAGAGLAGAFGLRVCPQAGFRALRRRLRSPHRQRRGGSLARRAAQTGHRLSEPSPQSLTQIADSAWPHHLIAQIDQRLAEPGQRLPAARPQMQRQLNRRHRRPV